MSVLESFCGLKMCADIKDCLLVKSFAFENSGIQEVYFLSEISAVNFIVGWRLFARTINSPVSFLSTFHIENMTSM